MAQGIFTEEVEKKYSAFYGIRGSLSSSKEPTTGPCPELSAKK
jgi:hypothetical protein